MSKRYSCTDTGNVARLVDHFAHKFRYVEAWGRFMFWDGKCWREDQQGNYMLGLTVAVLEKIEEEWEAAEDEDKERLGGWLMQSQGVGRRKAMVELVKGEASVRADPKEFDANHWLLNLTNGVLDLRTGALMPHDPEYKLTRTAAVVYRANAKSERWAAFLERIMPDPDTRAFLQRYAGYCLTGDVTGKLLVICHGALGNNGKTVFARTLQKMLEPFAIAINPDVLLARGGEPHPTELADLFGARLAVTSEVREGRVWDEEKLKRLTGNDVIRARRMHENFWQFEPTVKFLVLANLRPKVNDTSNSFWNRIALVPFEVSIPDDEIDPQLLDKLTAPKELSGVLNWALEGCKAYREGGLQVPETVRAARDQYRADEDLVGAFINDALQLNPLAKCVAADLMVAAKKWCEGRNVKAFGPRVLAERLRQCGSVQQTNTNGVRGWSGVGIQNTWRKAR